jgi:DNA-directed RNA polymerase specialized sigma24 family protein
MINYKTKKDEYLVKSIQDNKNAEQCLNVLIGRHSGLCVDMINGYVSKSNNDGLRHELIKEKDYQIYHSALKFNPNKGSKFSTYLGNEIKWKCLNIYNKNKRRKTVQVEEELINYFSYDGSGEVKPSDREIFSEVINQAKSHSDPRVGKIFHLRYVEGKNNSVMPWKNVSAKLEMSIQGCINIHDAAIKKFGNKIKKEINNNE